MKENVKRVFHTRFLNPPYADIIAQRPEIRLGNVGRRIAGLCRTLFGMQVLAYDPYLDEKTMAERGATKVELDELLRRSDFVSINCPLDDGSRKMISTREYGLMQKHAYFI